MQRFFPQLTVAGIVIAIMVIFNATGVQASSRAQTLPISILAQGISNYSVDSGFAVVPAVSMDIIQDKIRDETGRSPIHQVVTYPPGDFTTRSNSPAAPDPSNLASAPTNSGAQANPSSASTACTPNNTSCSNGNSSANAHRKVRGNGNGNGHGNRNGKGKKP